MTSVLSLILHYQKYIEKCPNDEKRVLRCIDKLHQLGVTVQHLQETGVGRTINALRKEQGDVGKAARTLVTKWKLMVAAEEDSSDPEDAVQAPESPQDSGRESDDNNDQHIVDHVNQEKEDQCYSYNKKVVSERHDDHHSRKRPSEHERPPEQNKRSKREHSSTERNNYEEHKHNPYANHENDNEENIDNSDQGNYDQQSNYKFETNTSSNLEDKRHTDHINRHKSHRHSEEGREHSSQKSKHQPKESFNEQTVPQSTSGSHHKSSRSDKIKETESKKHSSESTKYHQNKERSTERREREKSTTTIESTKHSSSDKHRHSRDKEKEKLSSKSKSKDSSSEKHKKSSHDKEKSRDDSISVSKDKLKQDKSKHSQNGEPNSKSHSSDTISHSSKEHSSKSRHESKKQSSHEGNGSSSKHREKSNDKSSSKNRESKSSKSSSSNDCDSRSVSSKELSEKPKKDKKVKIMTPASEDSEDGIDCESGASFAEALGMVSPTKSKKKSSSQKDSLKSSSVVDINKNPKSKSSTSNVDGGNSSSTFDGGNSSSTLSNEVQIASLLSPTTKLTPLPAIEISALPEISTNYKPRPPPKLMASLNTEEEALRSVMSNKNQRTKVYSGNKIYGILPSLYELCVFVLQEHIDALEYTGGVPYEILKPVVDRATPEQLFTLEHYNPYLMEDTNHLWQKHCEKRFRTKKRQEMETWREMYMRCQDEQDEKLKSLTANIKMSQEVKNAPTRQTKMAYVDSVVKPPRGIARKQAIHGTARAPVVSPAARVAALATGNVVKPESARPLPVSSGPPMRSSSSFVKPKKAPLMQKALQFMKGRIKR